MMDETSGERPPEQPASVPETGGLAQLRSALSGCRACGLWRHAEAAVPGRGPVPARVLVLGEQPLRTENRLGRPFTGRAGMLMRRALADADLDPDQVYFTNVVKHSRFVDDDPEQRHEKPSRTQATACRPWLVRELQLVRPRVVVLLGRVPVETVLGKAFPARRLRGAQVELPDSWGVVPAPTAVVTARPTSVHRSRQREKDYADLVGDLRLVRDLSLF